MKKDLYQKFLGCYSEGHRVLVFRCGMSEELIKRGYEKSGDSFGNWEYYSIGETNINALKKYGIVPRKTYGVYGNKAPDALVVDRTGDEPEVLLVVEYKTPKEFDSPAKKEAAIKQCIENYSRPLGAKVAIVTDNSEFIWLNPQARCEKGYEIALREDGYPIDAGFNTKGEIDSSIAILERCLDCFNEDNSQLLQGEVKNPSELADKVWQTIWLASGENPDICLATFVEIFLFKYLSDLGVLTVNEDGVDISFKYTLTVKEDRVFSFYFKNVRPFIKELFKSDEGDGTTIINGMVLDAEVSEHNFIFKEILESFEEFGELNNIDPEFKSRLYENFLKKSISQKNWGQFFTPRNNIKAINEMANLKSLPSGSVVGDPCSGVGGFLLEPYNTVRPFDYYFDDSGNLQSHINYEGFDRDKKTVILAKANMLIHLSELLKENPKKTAEFAKLFNRTFTSCHSSILGSLSNIEKDKYDLTMTNPPYVVTGTSTIKKYIAENSELSKYYKINGAGVEGLFVEKIIRSLKPGGKGFIIVPDGIFNRLSDSKLRQFILDECLLLGIISLPKNAFYTTPKKTYILCVQKKPNKNTPQVKNVFSYVITKTGETLDANRFEDDNDYPEMVKHYKLFHAVPEDFESPNAKCKVWDIEKFDPNSHWSVDRWWSAKERVLLGIDDEKTITDPEEFLELIKKHKLLVSSHVENLEKANLAMPEIKHYAELELSNTDYFDLFIGKRVVKKDLHNTVGSIPVYSANVNQPFGWMESSNIEDFSNPFVLWGIDGNFDFSVKLAGEVFRTTDHCGAIKILNSKINPLFLYFALHAVREENRLDRELRANLQNVKKFVVRIPIVTDKEGHPAMEVGDIRKDGTVQKLYKFDEVLQNKIVDYYTEFEEVKKQIMDSATDLNGLELETIKH